MKELEIVIGLEVHVQLGTESKIFCSCSTKFQSLPNTNICPVCCGYPGVLPVFNKRALELAVRVCLAMQCKINKKIYFERKNYFYPDLPKNYQISQYKKPLAEAGFLELPTGKKIKIERIHLEEDAGKLIHKESHSLADFNRSGIALLEIVSCPDIDSPQEAFDYLGYLKLFLQYIDVSNCDMEKGSLRCDANISLKKKEAKELGVKTELKNMNSFRGVKDALEYEAKRQESRIQKGEEIFQETRLWDVDKQKTVAMRTKEEARDYRYFPEPDLLDFFVSDEFINEEKKFIKESPCQKRKRFLAEYGLSEKETEILIANLKMADFFEQAVKFYSKPREISNWLIGPFLELLNSFSDKTPPSKVSGGSTCARLCPQGYEGIPMDKFKAVKITPANFSKIVILFSQKKINNLAAKKVLSLSIATNRDIDEIIEKEELLQVSSKEELISFVEEVIRDNPKPVKEYLNGKLPAIMFLIGQVMKKTKGTANPQVVKEMIEKSFKSRQ
ncbi:MAG: Asp-tRNA(Asn)/Glu-tRNA(Gln) amidotransferase subunit GatB [Candidatus Omnitrophica bacterium]|nr:Asp-tRNA(Asn)/Glu-tRNA(Gln) amidotransferase subunit GatB [Candidatus Omnitrophota bacterium]